MLSRRRSLVFVLVVGSILAAPATVVAGNPISVTVIVGFSCVSGSGPANREVIATLRTPELRMRGRVRTMTDAFGSWGACFRLFNPSTYINGGDRLRITIGNASRRIAVPHLEPRIDRVQNTIEGWAKPFVPVDIAVSHRTDFKNSDSYIFSTSTDANGHYLIDTSSEFNLFGWDQVEVITQQGNDLFGALAVTPGMLVSVNSNHVVGFVNNGTNLTLEVWDRDGNLKGDATAGPFFFGAFEVTMFNDDGSALYPNDRDRVRASFASDADVRIPVSELRGSAATDMVSGRCPPNAPYQLVVRNKVFYGEVGATGRFARDVGGKLNMKRGDDLTLYCQYATGDVWQDLDIAL